MVVSGVTAGKRIGPHRLTVVLRVYGVTILVSLLSACAGISPVSRPVDQLPPLEFGDTSLTVAEAMALTPTPDLLALDDEMRRFLARYVGDDGSARQRLHNLHRALVGAGSLDMSYDPEAEGTAREAFHRGSANCLSYAHLFIAMAREVGLDASYQWQEVRPQWTRLGERLAVQLHVNISVETSRGGRYVVDLDPLPRTQVAGTQALDDGDARALYHNNLAMGALAREELAVAWAHGVRALSYSPDMAHLWTNIGAIYRRAGQNRAAESSYLHALDLDPEERSAMNNLVVLYGLEGREAEREYWVAQVRRYRDANPFYHAYLGDKAGESGDWPQALSHYEEALDLLPRDSNLLYATGLIHYRMRNLEEAVRYLEQAIEHAVLKSDQETYRVRLKAIQQESLASR